MIVVHRINQAVWAHCRTAIGPGAVQAASLPQHSTGDQIQAVDLASHILKHERALVHEEWQEVPNGSVWLVCPQLLARACIKSLHFLVGLSIGRWLSPITGCQRDTLADHVEAVVLADVISHFCFPHLLAGLHIQGEDMTESVAAVHHAVVQGRCIHHLCRKRPILPYHDTILVKLPDPICSREVDIALPIYGSPIRQCRESTKWMMPLPSEGF
mmetsp:Transcript_132544/g.314210  ORF Transcript_132544/g.314210 Transcript_132544/m.314210 type:complete len:214 (-) Transcript_132544:286-927(-)